MSEIKPRTHFQILMDLCGLSHQETADYLEVSIHSVRQWARGNYPTPADASAVMVILWRQILGGTMPEGAEFIEMPGRAFETARAIEIFETYDPYASVFLEAPKVGRPRPTIKVRRVKTNPLEGS